MRGVRYLLSVIGGLNSIFSYLGVLSCSFIILEDFLASSVLFNGISSAFLVF